MSKRPYNEGTINTRKGNIVQTINMNPEALMELQSSISGLVAETLAEENIDRAVPYSDAEVSMVRRFLAEGAKTGDIPPNEELIGTIQKLIDFLSDGKKTKDVPQEEYARKLLRRYHELVICLSYFPPPEITTYN